MHAIDITLLQMRGQKWTVRIVPCVNYIRSLVVNPDEVGFSAKGTRIIVALVALDIVL